MAGKIRGWILDTIWKFKVSDGTVRTVFDEQGYLYQLDTKLTASASEINSLSTQISNVGTLMANTSVTDVDGSEGNKACSPFGLTMIEGGTGIADLTLAAPAVGAVVTIKLDSITSGSVVVTCATGVTLDGTNDVATFDAAGETLVLYYKAADEWAVAQNVGAVALSTSA
jgi:hypothetical protein